MPRRPTVVPLFATDPIAGQVVEPASLTRQGGFNTDEQPPAQWFNWLFAMIGENLDFLRGPSTSAWTRVSFPLGTRVYAVACDGTTDETGVVAPLRRILTVQDNGTTTGLHVSVRGQVWYDIAPGEPVEVAGPACLTFTGVRWVVGCSTAGQIFWTYPAGGSLGNSAIDFELGWTWTAATVPGGLTSILAITSDINTGKIAAITATKIIVSSNNGATFTEAAYGGSARTGSFCDIAVDGSAWIAVTDDGEIFRSTDLATFTREAGVIGAPTGAVWQIRTDQSTFIIFDFASSSAANMYTSIDHGVSWSMLALPHSGTNLAYENIIDLRYYDSQWYLSQGNSPYLSTSNDALNALGWVGIRIPIYSDSDGGGGILAISEGSVLQFGSTAGGLHPYVLIGGRAQDTAPGPWVPSSTPPMLFDTAYLRGRLVDDTAPTDGQVLSWNAGNDQWEPGAVIGILDKETVVAHSPAIGVGVGVVQSTSGAFAAMPAGATYGVPSFANGATGPTGAAPWPIPFAIEGNVNGSALITAGDTAVKVAWLDPTGAGVAATIFDAVVTIHWFA